MSKVFKKLFLLSSFSLPLVALSCSDSLETQIKALKFKINNDFDINAKLKPLYLSYFEGKQDVLNNYILSQKRLDDSYSQNVNSSLILTPLYANDLRSVSSISNSSKHNITDALSINSLWFLNHLGDFEFLYNPYGSKYTNNPLDAPKNVRRLFGEKIRDNGKVIQEITNTSEINAIYSFGVPNQAQDVYKDKQMHYLVYNNNTILALFSATDGNNQILKVLPSVIIFNQIENQVTQDQVQKFHEAFVEQRQSILDQEIKYQQDQLVADEVNLQQIQKANNDANFFSEYTLNNYSDAYKNIIQETNATRQSDYLTKYTWGFINEV